MIFDFDATNKYMNLKDFKTTKVVFKIGNEEIELDIASTRKEYYQHPASLPNVTEIGCNIYDDIVRRDFTINSMALSLNQASFCKLIDPLSGYKDIKEGKIRILHPLSFINDPTRIIRALKFRERFTSQLEKATDQLQETCLESGLFDSLAGERIKAEIKQTFNLNKAECLRKFIEEKIYFLIDKDIQEPQNAKILSEKTQKIIKEYDNFISSKDLTWLIYLGVLIVDESKDNIKKIADKLYLSGLETEILLGSKGIKDRINILKSSQTQYEIYEILEGYFPESILISLIKKTDKEIEDKINLYINELQDIKIYTTGKDLIEAGITPGPMFGEILRELLQAKINKEISTQEDEKEYIKKFIPRI